FPAGGGGDLMLASSGHTPEMRMDFTATFPWMGNVWNGRIFFEPSDDSEARSSPMIAAQNVAGGRTAGTAPDPLRISGDRVGSYWTPAPTPVTYLWPIGDSIAFGDGFALPLVFYRSSSPSDLAIEVGYAGPVGEMRTPEAPSVIRSIDDAGNAVAQRSDAVEIADPARLRRLEIVSEGGYLLEGARGTASLTARFGYDASDRVPPSLTSLRVLRGDGKVAARFAKGAPASLVVSAIDYAPGNVAARVKEGSLAVSYRRMGAEQWTPLTVTSQGEDFAAAIAEHRPPYGAIARADLGGATSAHGYYDVKITVEDARGNATETILSPAFVVSAPPRVRTVRR
ncbi:MAG TPA: hypothetical protein VFV54_04735, partial [Thermoanaerobaculia bacterium]|nr:hypothetical protein [Thermoanaerobaculia bacterium]